jgi:hypothetical protein
MLTVNSETRTPVTDVSYFKPHENRTDDVTSLEEWAAAARLLKPDITDILNDVKADSNTKKRFQHAKTPTNFKLTDMDYTITGNDDCDKKPTYNSLPDRSIDKTNNELLLNISSGSKSALRSVQRKKTQQ